jgi:hypothetical protein
MDRESNENMGTKNSHRREMKTGSSDGAVASEVPNITKNTAESVA